MVKKLLLVGLMFLGVAWFVETRALAADAPSPATAASSIDEGGGMNSQAVRVVGIGVTEREGFWITKVFPLAIVLLLGVNAVFLVLLRSDINHLLASKAGG